MPDNSMVSEKLAAIEPCSPLVVRTGPLRGLRGQVIAVRPSGRVVVRLNEGVFVELNPGDLDRDEPKATGDIHLQ